MSGVSGVTIEFNNPQSVSEITINFLAGQNKNRWPQALVSAKIPMGNNELIYNNLV